MVQLVYFAAGSTAPAEAARTYASAGAAPLAAYLRRLAWFGVGTTAAALLAFTLAPAQLLELIFGAAYAAAAPLVPGLALFQALLFLDLALVTGLSVLDRTEQVWQATKWGPLMGLLLAYPLVAALGLQGAVLGCLVTMSAQIALEWRAFRAALRETPSRAHHAHAG
jgi:O-antigen/teichoic acid export membrane protein